MKPCRILDHLACGLRAVFSRARSAGRPARKASPEQFAELVRRYGFESRPETIPELLQRFGLRMGEQLSGGWTP